MVKVMTYTIKGCYCEKLNISQYVICISEGSKINMNLDFKTKLHQIEEDLFLLKIYYLLESDSTPISLNWVGVAVIEVDDPNIELDKDELLKEKDIESFIENSISHLPQFFHGTLPNFDWIKENQK